MSNQLYVSTGKFIVDKDGSSTRCIRVADDYGEFYDQDDSIPEAPEAILQWVMDNPFEYGHEAVTAMMDFAVENEKGACINGEWVGFETVAKIYNETLGE